MSDKDKFMDTNDFDSWIKDLEEKDQPSCNIDNDAGCDSCGS